jgi:hypothetical protein
MFMAKKGYYFCDPASMFCLEISRILDGYKHTKSFCRVLRAPQRSLHYLAYAGLVKEYIPSEDEFSNFRVRCGGEKYGENPLLSSSYLPADRFF